MGNSGKPRGKVVRRGCRPTNRNRELQSRTQTTHTLGNAANPHSSAELHCRVHVCVELLDIAESIFTLSDFLEKLSGGLWHPVACAPPGPYP